MVEDDQEVNQQTEHVVAAVTESLKDLINMEDDGRTFISGKNMRARKTSQSFSSHKPREPAAFSGYRGDGSRSDLELTNAERTETDRRLPA